MKHDRLDRPSWFFGCLLACFFGLSQSSFAATLYPTYSDAFAACQQALFVGTSKTNAFFESLPPPSSGSTPYQINRISCLTSGSIVYLTASIVSRNSVGTPTYFTCRPQDYIGTVYKGITQAGTSDVPPAGISLSPSCTATAFSFSGTGPPTSAACAARPVLTGRDVFPADDFCYNGCKYHGYISIPANPNAQYPAFGSAAAITAGYGDTAGTGVTCSDPNPPRGSGGSDDPTQDSDGDGIPDQQDPYPNDPTNGGTVGSGTGSGSGNGNTAGGGGTCYAPPSCSGDAIGCATLYQSWAGRCATENLGDPDYSVITDGLDALGSALGGKLDTLSGKADSQLTAQAATTTAVNGVTAAVNANTAAVNGLGTQLSELAGDGGHTDDGSIGNFLHTQSLSTSVLSDTGFGFPRTCPLFDDFSIPLPGGTTYEVNMSAMTGHCTVLEWLGLLVLAFSAFEACKLLIRR